MSEVLGQLKAQFTQAIKAQDEQTRLWHQSGEILDEAYRIPQLDKAELVACVLAQHKCNIMLWHIEDMARRKDVTAEQIAACKAKIDGLNQQRNDGMELIDACFMYGLAPHLPIVPAKKHNTESLGSAVDRLSILSLKIFHMDEQLLRKDVGAEHISSCAGKACVLREQRGDLEQAVLDLLDDFVSGLKQPKQYFQFKMYNDPNLNPQLYAPAGNLK